MQGTARQVLQPEKRKMTNARLRVGNREQFGSATRTKQAAKRFHGF